MFFELEGVLIKMQDFTETIVIFGLIGIVVGFVNWKSLKNKENFSRENNTVVRLPSFYQWVGLLGTIFFVTGAFGGILFPKIFVKSPLIENLLISFPFVLLGIYLTQVGLFWNIQVDEGSDYFIYRTTFGRRYKIFYNEITYYKTEKHAMIMKYKRKFFVIDTYAINYDVFLQMLIKKDVIKKFKRT
jgi:hypothetical protein